MQSWVVDGNHGKLTAMLGSVRIVNVEYVIPNKPEVSEECKDLLRKLIVFDPKKRLTIRQIAKHPWFCKGLPPDIFAVNDR